MGFLPLSKYYSALEEAKLRMVHVFKNDFKFLISSFIRNLVHGLLFMV
jgi:hypothetical protein